MRCITVVVVTNRPDETTNLLSSGVAGGEIYVGPWSQATFAATRCGDGQSHLSQRILVFPWRPTSLRRHGFFLTWAHKDILRRGLQSGHFTHFVYLEDDLRLYPESLQFWADCRPPLAALGLVPGFVRYECFEGRRYVVDQTARQVADKASVTVTSKESASDVVRARRFVELGNPYQGMYVLDRQLADEHFTTSAARCPWRSAAVRWPELIRERAAIGPIYDEVPEGFSSRSVVPLVEAGPHQVQLEERCLIEHMAGNYSRSPDSPFAKIVLEEMFE